MSRPLPELHCSVSGEQARLEDAAHRSSAGHPWQLDWQSTFPRERISRRVTDMWRYREALPVDYSSRVSLGEGMSPLVPFEWKGGKVLFKCEHQLPSGSYKDRGAALLVSALRQAGVNVIKEDSSGNAGAALATYAARAGMRARIFVPASASGGKLSQIKATGATLETVEGPRQAATDAALREYKTEYYASHIWNPFFEHGVKTIAFEIAEQLGWKAPDRLILPAGHGCLLLAVWRGFKELHQAGVIDNLPKLQAVQAENCSPLYTDWSGKTSSGEAKTAAEGIAISHPCRATEVLQAVRESGGAVTIISEEQLCAAHQQLLSSGFCVEPTSAVAFAAWINQPQIEETTIIPLTGHGLKSL